MKKQKPLSLILKVRKYKGGDDIVTVHLVERDGGAESCFIHGEMSSVRADRLVKWFESLGVEVESEQSPLAGTKLIQERKQKKLKRIFD